MQAHRKYAQLPENSAWFSTLEGTPKPDKA
jgi:hypothetical protein